MKFTQSGLTYMNRFTGLTDGKIPYPSTDSTRTDSSNMGTRFWVGYGRDGSNMTTLKAKIGGSATDANVTVKVHGTDWVRNYHVPANTFIYTDDFPPHWIIWSLPAYRRHFRQRHQYRERYACCGFC